MEKWIWIPNIRLNDLYFNKSYNQYDKFISDKQIVQYDNGLFDDNEVTYLYDNVGIFTFYYKEKIFNGAEIKSNLFYNNKNLIGLTVKELQQILATDDLILSKDGYYYSSEKLNALFWIENNKVVSISI